MIIPYIVLLLALVSLIVLLRGKKGKTASLYIIAGEPQLTGETMQLQMNDHQKLFLSISPKDRDGDPAPIDGLPSWDLYEGDPELLNLFPSEDGMSCEVFANGRTGVATVKCSADVDLGEGVSTIEEFIQFTITQSPVTDLGLTATQPVDVPPADQ